ncbi:MAG: ABC transporter ATP-binding protein [Armatimonadota bacterium]|nr:ABC transporter ATP-binding protein [Armatimonadota bacterium]MDR7510461.1 ABC transporter ATP-binding protein [Armatimonadota bacterium]
MTPPTPVVALRGITKRFGHVVANDGVDLDLYRGQIHGLLGENGSGKTTLMSILYGLVQPDAGEIRVDGAPVVLAGPRAAVVHGIAMIPQQFRLVPTLTVAENIALGLDARGRWHGAVLATIGRRLLDLSEQYGLQVRPHALVGALSMGERQRVEILRALYHESRVLLMDEPTSVLTPQEVDRLFGMLAVLARREGRSIVLVTHKIREVTGLADHVTVLRQGRRVASLVAGEATVTALVDAMIGPRGGGPPATADRDAPGGRATAGSVLTVRGLRVVPVAGDDLVARPLHDVTFAVHGGEIFGIAGVEGNGQRELELALVGLLRPRTGTITLTEGAVAYVPSDRTRWGLVLDFTVAENVLMRRATSGSAWASAPTRQVTALAEATDLVRRFAISPPRLEAVVRHLSGGNMQKVVVARELSRLPVLVVAAQPTMGLDVATAAFVRSQLRRVAAAGAAVVLISSDLEELLELADRVGVLYQGHLVGVWDARSVTVETLGMAMAGLSVGAPPGRPVGEPVHPTH